MVTGVCYPKVVRAVERFSLDDWVERHRGVFAQPLWHDRRVVGDGA